MSGRFQRPTVVTSLWVAALLAGQASAQDGPSVNPSVGLAPSHPGIITNPIWISPPRPDASTMTIEPRSGLVDLACTSRSTGEVTDCAVTYETPNEAGLSKYALEALDAALLSPRTVDGAAEDSLIRFGVHFRSGGLPAVVSEPVPPAPTGAASLITSPAWARLPMSEFPERAASLGIESGQVSLNCGFISSGDLTECRIVEELQAEAGFGDSAMAGSHRGRLAKHIVIEAPAGSRVQFPVRYILN